MKILVTLFLLISSIYANKIDVTVSIVPQQYFVEKIAKDKAIVNVMVQPGFSPETYEPKTSQMKKLASSDIYFAIGVPFENSWLNRFKGAHKSLNVVDTSKGVNKLEMTEHFHEDEHHHGHNHAHDHKHEHHKDALDPHIWLDPTLVKIQAKNIYEAFAKLDSKNAKFYEKNYNDFLIELDDLDKKVKNILKPVSHKAFMVFHPAFGYFAHRYHLEQIAVEVSGKEPKPAQLIKLIDEAKRHNIKVVFVSPEFSQQSAKVIAQQINAKVVPVSTLKKDWDTNLIFLANSIVESYK